MNAGRKPDIGLTLRHRNHAVEPVQINTHAEHLPNLTLAGRRHYVIEGIIMP
jgi:hypothetical protein